MKHQIKKTSALADVDGDLITAVGKAMVIFAAIEGFVNFELGLLIQNHIVWTKLTPTSIMRRLNLFCDLIVAEDLLPKDEMQTIIKRAKNIFRKRNLIAHNPIVFSNDGSEQKLMRLGGGAQEALTAKDILKMAEEANEIYHDIRLISFNYKMERMEKRGSNAESRG